MAEDFNDLIDQTETRAQALVLEADKAIALLDSVDAMVDKLSSTIEESANEAKESFDTLTEQITTAGDTLQTQQETAKESMNGLMQQVQEAGGKIQESLTNAFNKFSELQTKKQEFLGEVGEDLDNVNSIFGELREECYQTTEKLDRGSTELNDKGEQLSNSTRELDQGLGTEKQSLIKNLLDFEEVVETELESAAEESSNLMNYLYEDFNKLAEPIQKMFDKSVVPEEEEFLQAVEKLNEVVEDAEKEILKTGDFQITSEENLSKVIQESSGNILPTLEHFDELKHILDQIEGLLT